MAFDDLDVNAFFDFDAATDEELEGNDKSNEVDTAWSTRDPSEILALLPSTSPFLAPLNMGGYSTNTTPPATSSSSSSSSSQAPSSVPGTPQTAEGENLSSEDTMEASSGGPPEAGDEHAQSTHQADHNSPPGEIPAPLARPTTRSMRRLAATRLTAQRTAGTDRSDRENTAAVKREPTPTTPSGSQGTTATKRKRSSREDEGPVAGPSSVTLDDLDAEQSSTKSERAAPKKPRHRRTKEEVDADQKRACTATKCGLDGGCDWILTDDTRRNKKHLRDNHYAGGRAGATIDAGTSSSATQSQATGTLRCSWGTTEGQCGRTYSGATPLANLERHVEGHHWGRQLVCDRCGQAFDRVWLLTRHKKSCGKGKDRDDKDADDEEQPPQKKRRR